MSIVNVIYYNTKLKKYIEREVEEAPVGLSPPPPSLGEGHHPGGLAGLWLPRAGDSPVCPPWVVPTPWVLAILAIDRGTLALIRYPCYSVYVSVQ